MEHAERRAVELVDRGLLDRGVRPDEAVSARVARIGRGGAGDGERAEARLLVHPVIVGEPEVDRAAARERVLVGLVGRRQVVERVHRQRAAQAPALAARRVKPDHLVDELARLGRPLRADRGHRVVHEPGVAPGGGGAEAGAPAVDAPAPPPDEGFAASRRWRNAVHSF